MNKVWKDSHNSSWGQPQTPLENFSELGWVTWEALSDVLFIYLLTYFL